MTKKQKTNTPKLPLIQLLIGVGIILAISLFVFVKAHTKSIYAHKDACNLLSVNEIQKITNDTFEKDSDPIFRNENLKNIGINAHITYCAYSRKSYTGGKQSYAQYASGVDKYISLSVEDGQDENVISIARKGFGKAKTEEKSESVKDVGDEAYYVPGDGTLAFLYKNYRVNVTYWAVANVDKHETHDKIISEKIAKTIIENIKK
jgi:hypothetical protein